MKVSNIFLVSVLAVGFALPVSVLAGNDNSGSKKTQEKAEDGLFQSRSN